MQEDTNPFQENLERSARLSALLLFSAPPVTTSLVAMVLAGLGAGVLGGARPAAFLDGLLLVTLPAIVAALATTPVARALGGTLYVRRAALLALGGAVVMLAGVAGTVLAGLWGFPAVTVIFLALGFQLTLRQSVLTVISDHRHLQTLAAALLQPSATLVVLAWRVGVDGATWGPGLLLWIVVLGPFMLVQSLFDAPLSRNFDVSASQIFRHYLDHITTGSEAAEDIIQRLGEPIEAPVAVLAFCRPDGTPKACMVVPAVHPGPFGALGGGDLPSKIAEAMPAWPMVLVPHAAANHDFNPVASSEVEKLAHVAAGLAAAARTAPGSSPLCTAGTNVRVSAQAFGEDCLLTYTSWPEAIDDVDYGVGLAAELEAHAAGFRHAVFVDCHNSLKPGAGAVFPCQPRALAIQARAREAAAAAAEARSPELRVGISEDRSLGTKDLVGAQGCQALVVEAGGTRTAYVLWDGNNMLPEATSAIATAVLEVADACQVMTTDNHSVNVAGAFSPVGARGEHATLARIARETVRRAVADLEPVQAGIARGHVPGLRVFGHHKTAQLAASVNTMTSVLPELVVVCVGLWVMGIALVFLAL